VTAAVRRRADGRFERAFTRKLWPLRACIGPNFLDVKEFYYFALAARHLYYVFLVVIEPFFTVPARQGSPRDWSRATPKRMNLLARKEGQRCDLWLPE